MRGTTVRGVNIKYADEIGYAFMPCLLSASYSALASVDVTLLFSNGGSRYSFSAEAYNGSVVTDYREYIQAFFDSVKFGQFDYTAAYNKSQLGETVVVALQGKNASGGTLCNFTFSTFYVWGAMRAGETWNVWKSVRYFRKFPFTLGLYADAATKILFGRNDTPSTYIELPGKGMYEIPGTNLPTAGEWSTVYDFDGEIKSVTFTDAFDLTFRLQGGTQTRLLRIEYDDSESGVYLRWVDRHGFYRYWLFAAGNEVRAVSSGTSFIRNNLGEYDDAIYGYYGANGRRQSYEREDTVSLCAPLVDRDTYDMLQDIASSPVVDMYLGGDKWQSVTIKTGSYTKTTAILQDFTCSMVINNTNIQKL